MTKPYTPGAKKTTIKPHEIILADDTTLEGSPESHATQDADIPVKSVVDASSGAGIISLIKSKVGKILTLRTITGATLVGPNNNEINVFPVGGIIMWSGTLANVPSGWYLCDGTNGTPDLRDKFILGWAAGVDPGGTGGSTQHKHAVGTLAASAPSVDAHTTTAVQSGAGTTVLTGPVNHTVGTPTISGKTANAENGAGSTTSEDIYPPFYKLAFLMKG